MGVGDVLWQTALQSRVDSSVLSRVSSYDWLGSMALLPGGYALSGLLAASLDASKLLAGGGGASDGNDGGGTRRADPTPP